MRDPRFDKLAELLISHSTKLQAGENVLFEVFDVPDAMAIALVEAAYKVGASPMVNVRSTSVTRALLKELTEESIKLKAD